MYIGYLVLALFVLAILLVLAALVWPHLRKLWHRDWFAYYVRRATIPNSACLMYYSAFGSYGRRYAARFRLRNIRSYQYRRFKESVNQWDNYFDTARFIAIILIGLTLSCRSAKDDHQYYLAKSLKTGRVKRICHNGRDVALNVFNINEPVHVDSYGDIKPDTTLETFIIVDYVN